MKDPLIYFNGIDGDTGQYSQPAMSFQDFVEHTHGERLAKRRPKGLKAGLVGDDLASAGWGVVFPPDADPAIQDALAPLLDHRRDQATAQDQRRFRDDLTCGPHDNALTFLTQRGAGFGPVDPDVMPYYLLLVGSPQQISYSFQYDLDVQHAVGRLYFETPEDYANYARGVLEAEKHGSNKARQATLFGVDHADDEPTTSSTEHLIKPLVEAFSGKNKCPAGWRIEKVPGKKASKQRLSEILSHEDSPSILFTAGHAMCFHPDNDRQLTHQGALLCSDWPGPKVWRERVPEAHYFAAHDLEDQADLTGMITFHFACYSAGTPRIDHFISDEEKVIAPRDFVARLPQRMLSLPGGSALASIGHIDRAWEHSFLWQQDPAAMGVSQAEVFISTLRRLMNGQPVGLATKYFGQRYAALATYINTLRRAGETPEVRQLLARLWAAYYDAQGYVVLGDPAVRLCPPRL